MAAYETINSHPGQLELAIYLWEGSLSEFSQCSLDPTYNNHINLYQCITIKPNCHHVTIQILHVRFYMHSLLI